MVTKTKPLDITRFTNLIANLSTIFYPPNKILEKYHFITNNSSNPINSQELFIFAYHLVMYCSIFPAQKISERNQQLWLKCLDVTFYLIIGDIFKRYQDSGIIDISEFIIYAGPEILHLGRQVHI